MKKEPNYIFKAQPASEHNVFYYLLSHEYSKNGTKNVVHYRKHENHAKQPSNYGKF